MRHDAPVRWLSISRAERSTSYFIRPIRLVFSTVASDYPSFAPVTNAAQTDERHNREREDCGPSYCSESHLQTTPQFRAGLWSPAEGPWCLRPNTPGRLSSRTRRSCGRSLCASACCCHRFVQKLTRSQNLFRAVSHCVHVHSRAGFRAEAWTVSHAPCPRSSQHHARLYEECEPNLPVAM